MPNDVNKVLLALFSKIFFSFLGICCHRMLNNPVSHQKSEKKSQNFEYAYVTYHWTGNFTLFSILSNKITQINSKKRYVSYSV